MCRYNTIEVSWTPYENGPLFRKHFEKPAHLWDWCPKCSPEDPQKRIQWMKHMCCTVAEDNAQIICRITQGNAVRKNCIPTLPNTFEDLDRLFSQLLVLNVDLKNKELKIIEDDLTKETWDSVKIIAPFLSYNKKKAIINIMDVDNVSQKIEGMLGDNYEVSCNASRKNISVIVSKKKEECNICFSKPVSSSPRCRTCKNAYACDDCERGWPRCAFCNTSF